jgi:6-phosphogluconolactonase
MKHDIHRCQNLEDIGIRAASFFIKYSNDAIHKRGQFTVALSGGKTPEFLFRILAQHDHRKSIEWKKIKVFWGDERFVSKDHPESNFGIAYRVLLSQVPIPEENIFAIPTDTGSSTRAAELYEESMRRFFGRSNAVEGTPPKPVFDLVLLGLGKDGHTASLFQENRISDKEERWVMAVEAPPLYPTTNRVTVSLPVINSARTVAFLVSGEDKKEVLQSVLLSNTAKENPLPAQRVNPSNSIVWFTDIDVGGF